MLKAIIKPDFLRDAYLKIGKLKGDNIKYLREASWDCSWYWGFGLLSGMDYANKDIDGWTHVDSTIIEPSWKDLPELTMFEEHVFQTETEVWQFIELMQQFYKMREAANIIYSCGAHITSIKDLKGYYRSPEMVTAGRKINRELIPEVIRRIYALLVPEGSTLTVSTPAYWGDWATLDEYLLCKKEKPWDTRLQAPRVLTCDEEQRLKEM